MRVRDRALARSVGTRGRLLTGPRQKYQEVRERIRAAGGVEALRKGGATVTAVVQASTPQRLILSLPDHGHAIAIATPPPLGWNLAGAAAAAAAAPRFEVGAPAERSGDDSVASALARDPRGA